jgi:hypothetical protein
LLTLPIALWSLLMFTPSFMHSGRDSHIGAAVVDRLHDHAVLRNDAHRQNLPLAALVLRCAWIPLPRRLHRRS